MKQALKIYADDTGLLTVTLLDILSQIEEGNRFRWKILYLEAIGQPKGKTMLDLENEVNNSLTGLSITWIDLLELSKSISQVVNILLIGDKDPNKLVKYESENSLDTNCDFCFELIDSSYWEISCADASLVGNKLMNLPGAVRV